MLTKGAVAKPEDAITPNDAITLARYALEGLPSKVMAANYQTVLPDAELLQKELEKTRQLLKSRSLIRSPMD